MLNLSNLKVDIEGSRILNGISLTVGGGRTGLPGRAQRRRQDHDVSQHHGLSPPAVGRHQPSTAPT